MSEDHGSSRAEAGASREGGDDSLPKFTRGPWEYVASNEHHGPYITTAADGTYGDIADCYVMSMPSELSTRNGGPSRPVHHQHERADANARLMAAAPELYEACRYIVEARENGDETTAFIKARAALAKARGEA